MNVTVFGATGPSGKLFVEKALRAGHQVTAFVRDPSKLERAPRLEVITGTLDDVAAIESAVRGADAVVSLLGPAGKTAGRPITEGTARILTAMQKHGVMRLVATATPSFADPEDRPDLRFRILVTMVRKLVPSAYAEIVGTGEAIARSDRDFTIVRLPFLTNRPASGAVRAGYLGRGLVRGTLGREALADFLLGQLTDVTWRRKAPAISE